MTRRPTQQPAASVEGTTNGKERRTEAACLGAVPEARATRAAIRQRCGSVAAEFERRQPPTQSVLEQAAHRILQDLGTPLGYVSWTMVTLASAFWNDQVAAVPLPRRLCLLPHCLRIARHSSTDQDERRLEHADCGACSICNVRARAERLGYTVLVANGSSAVLKAIVSGSVDAIVGVASLSVLERAIDKILLAGIPCMAIPLLPGNHRDTSVDEDWVREMLSAQRPIAAVPTRTRTYLHLMRRAEQMFRPTELRRLTGPCQGLRSTGGENQSAAEERLHPVDTTATIAFDFLGRGGKHLRPFITLATFDAVTGGHATLADGPDHLDRLPDAAYRAALSIEVFHKASLVHDDIEDDDAYRYGSPTLHRSHGIPAAINVGDYLIGLGYRLVSQESANVGAKVAADILDRLAEAHMRLCEGQGAELAWRDAHDKDLTPADALRIYALKTAPAFEAALYAGLRLAGPVDAYCEPIRQFARDVGIAFQILNDLKDWHDDRDNKLKIGEDALHQRPTLLWALAAGTLTGRDRSQLMARTTADENRAATVDRVRTLYQKAGVFETADQLVTKYQRRAEETAATVAPESLQHLLGYLTDTILQRPTGGLPHVVPVTLPSGLTVVA